MKLVCRFRGIISYLMNNGLFTYYYRGIYKLPNRVIRELREELDALRKESEDHHKYNTCHSH